MKRINNIVVILSAIIVGGAILAAGLQVSKSINRGAAEVAVLRAGISQLETATRNIQSVAASDASPPLPAEGRRNNPLANRRFDVSVAGAPWKGAKEPKIELVEFTDFQCPYCSRVLPTLNRIEADFGDTVRIIFKHLPLNIHADAPAAHAAAEAAHVQGKFWEMHDLIFSDQRNLMPKTFETYAVEIGLDLEKFRLDVQSNLVASRIRSDMADAEILGVRGTPGFFVNGRFFSGVRSYEAFRQIIESELAL